MAGFLGGIMNRCGCGDNDDSSLLFFFLLLVVIFCQSDCFGDENSDSLLFFFLLLIVLFSGGMGDMCGNKNNCCAN